VSLNLFVRETVTVSLTRRIMRTSTGEPGTSPQEPSSHHFRQSASSVRHRIGRTPWRQARRKVANAAGFRSDEERQDLPAPADRQRSREEP